ncbi:MAG: alcohol dehydrogenase catalytic domain-containing protein [Clostridiales bacterium]|nr:alcohol dehydrogenase catalytic domain-containing protein [Clostridiales bacterium]
MKAWILEDIGKLTLQESQPTEITENQIKVKIEEVLLNNSDFEIYTGASKRKYPFIIGRNAVGVVSMVHGDNQFFQKMDRVAIEPYIPCETCDECRNEQYDKCSNMQELGYNCNGLLRNFVDLPYAQLHRLPDQLSNEKALFVPIVAFCLNIVDALNLEKGRHIAIFASSKTGLILAQLVAYYQAVPVLISSSNELLDMAREMGIFYCFNPEETEVENEIVAVTSGRMCKELILLSNSDFNMKDVYNVAAFNANICLAGYSNKESKMSVANICRKHLNIFGVYNGAGNFSSAINLLVTDTVNVDTLIGSTIDFDALDKEMAKLNPKDLEIKSFIVKVN